ncbi:MAG: DUF302 domain-containing protein [Gammaproteobacteria bacterium]|jgi:uncharacterized protein (DUF302 family)|nr:DUF302 domain-containing protein [Gammaproteobacteria bacterium]
MNNKYGFGKSVPYSLDIALDKVKEELQKEGFGILTVIDVAATFKKKLDLDMPPYQILGACNPQLAQRALQVEPSIGLLLPCNVVVRMDANDKVYVEFMDPNVLVEIVNHEEIRNVAVEVKQRLERVMAKL